MTSIGVLGGAASDSTGAWVSDATSGTIQRLSGSSATGFSSGAAAVYGLDDGPAGIVFAYASGYGLQPDSGAASLFPTPIPSGASYAQSEISFDPTSENAYLGGYISHSGNCTKGIVEVPTGGSVGSPFPGNVPSTSCTPMLLRLDSTGGAVWFSEGTTTQYLSYLNPGTGKVADRGLPAAAAGATPGDMAAGANRDMYFSLCNVTDPHPGGGNYLVRVNAGSTQQTVFSTYSTCASTRDSMVYDGHDGRVWLANGTNTLTAVRTTDGAVSTYALGTGGVASSGFLAVTLGPDRALWAFRNGDFDAYAYADALISAVPSYAYTLHGQPVNVQISEMKYSGDFTPSVVSGSDASCTVTPITSTPQTQFAVASAPHTSCTVAFTDANGIGTVYVPLVTSVGSGIPPQPH